MAKKRLAPVLSEEQRRNLVLAMARDVLRVLKNSTSIAKILLVSSEPEAGHLFRDRNVDVFYSHRDEGINRDLESAAAYALSQGAGRVLIVHGDLPFLKTAIIREFIEGAPQGVFRVARCKNGKGTNVLLAPLPLEINLKFGRNSHQRFVEEAAKHELQIETVVDKHLGMDIDTPEDFRKLMKHGDETPLMGSATRAVLNDYTGRSDPGDKFNHRESNPTH